MKTETEIREMLDVMRWMVFSDPAGFKETFTQRSRVAMTGILTALASVLDVPPLNGSEGHGRKLMDEWIELARGAKKLQEELYPDPERN